VEIERQIEDSGVRRNSLPDSDFGERVMKIRYDLQSRHPEKEWYLEWKTVASSPVSGNVAVANYKKSRAGYRDGHIERAKAEGWQYRLVKVEILEKIVDEKEL
jgi:hypothetical protein